MSVFDQKNNILRDETPLLEVFIPERMLHRENQRQYVADCMKPAAMKRKPRNVFLYGPPGVGKTSLIKWMFKEFENYTDKAKTIYINCWENPTTNSILNVILSHFEVFTSPRNSSQELLQILAKTLNRLDKTLIVALDEVDRMTSDEILYDLSRSGYGVVCIANDRYALMNVDPRIKSSLAIESIEFPKYKPEELFNILKDRIDYSFCPNVISDKEIKTISILSDGDARIGLEILRKAALVAEEDSEKVSIEHIKEVSKDLDFQRRDRALSNLNNAQKTLYELVKENKRINSNVLFNKFKELGKSISIRSYRNYMQKLVKERLVICVGGTRYRQYEVVN